MALLINRQTDLTQQVHTYVGTNCYKPQNNSEFQCSTKILHTYLIFENYSSDYDYLFCKFRSEFHV